MRAWRDISITAVWYLQLVMMVIMWWCDDDDDVMVVAETERRVKANQQELNASFNYAVSQRRFFPSCISRILKNLQNICWTKPFQRSLWIPVCFWVRIANLCFVERIYYRLIFIFRFRFYFSCSQKAKNQHNTQWIRMKQKPIQHKTVRSSGVLCII